MSTLEIMIAGAFENEDDESWNVITREYTDSEKLAAIERRIDEAGMLLACSALNNGNSHPIASALEQLFKAAETLAQTLQSLTAVREP